MGRNARIRKQRKQPLAAQASLLAKRVAVSAEKEKPSLIQQLLDKINPLPKVDVEKWQPCLRANDFTELNQVLIGAVAWEGFLQGGIGVVVVQDLADSPPVFEYVPQRFLKKKLRAYGITAEDSESVGEMCQVYDPTKRVIIMYMDSEGEISTSLSPQIEPSPEVCYHSIRQELGS